MEQNKMEQREQKKTEQNLLYRKTSFYLLNFGGLTSFPVYISRKNLINIYFVNASAPYSCG